MQILEEPRVEEQTLIDALREVFAAQGAPGAPALPQQAVVPLPSGGDVIHYPGIGPGRYAVKVSPYIPREGMSPIVSAWTMLVDLATGDPIAIVNAGRLTTERTGATSALAADWLLPADASSAAIIGLGAVGEAHARYLKAVRPSMSLRGWSRTPPRRSLPADVAVAETLEAAIDGVDLVMLCTSAADTVIDPRLLAPGTVVTSISTNAPGAREVPVEAITDMDVYVDARSSVLSAAELKEATARGWDPENIRGDLSELATRRAKPANGGRTIYFRSIGLGIEDLAAAVAALKTAEEQQ